MDEKTLINDENEKFVYGFSTTELVESVRISLSSSYQKVLLSLQEKLKIENVEISDEKLQKVHELFMVKAMPPLEKFEKEVRSILGIEDCKKMDIPEYTDEDIEKLMKENDELAKEYLREKMFLTKLKQRKNDFNEKIKPVYEKMENNIKNYKSNLDKLSTATMNSLKLIEETVDLNETKQKELDHKLY